MAKQFVGIWALPDLLNAPGEFDNGNSGAAANVDWSKGPAQKITLTANCVITAVNLPAGRAVWIQLKAIQDGTGFRSITFSGAKTPGATPLAQSTTAGATDIFSLYWDGANLYATVGGLALA